MLRNMLKLGKLQEEELKNFNSKSGEKIAKTRSQENFVQNKAPIFL